MFKLGFEGTDLIASIDADKDNAPSVKLAVKAAELLTEFNGGKGEFKKASFEFSGSKLLIKGDLNQDGEPSFVLEVDLAEGFSEVLAAVKK